MAEDVGDEEVARRIASVPTWYHAIEVAPGHVTPGCYDLRPFVGRFGIPDSLDGADVIDVGASNGFFSFELERRGARRVVAVDAPSLVDLDYPAWYVERERAGLSDAEVDALDRTELRAGFEVARELLGSRVERREARVYDLPRAIPERFDLAFCSNVLGHLRDPVAAIEAMRDVLVERGRLILASPVDLTDDQSYALFMGDPALARWWVPSRLALLRMCRMAGFESVEWRGSFDVPTPGAQARAGTLGVVHCRRGG